MDQSPTVTDEGKNMLPYLRDFIVRGHKLIVVHAVIVTLFLF